MARSSAQREQRSRRAAPGGQRQARGHAAICTTRCGVCCGPMSDVLAPGGQRNGKGASAQCLPRHGCPAHVHARAARGRAQTRVKIAFRARAHAGRLLLPVGQRLLYRGTRLRGLLPRWHGPGAVADAQPHTSTQRRTAYRARNGQPRHGGPCSSTSREPSHESANSCCVRTATYRAAAQRGSSCQDGHRMANRVSTPAARALGASPSTFPPCTRDFARTALRTLRHSSGRYWQLAATHAALRSRCPWRASAPGTGHSGALPLGTGAPHPKRLRSFPARDNCHPAGAGHDRPIGHCTSARAAAGEHRSFSTLVAACRSATRTPPGGELVACWPYCYELARATVSQRYWFFVTSAPRALPAAGPPQRSPRHTARRRSPHPSTALTWAARWAPRSWRTPR